MKKPHSLFVSYEVALKLNELGFDEKCFGQFVDTKFVPLHAIYSYHCEKEKHEFILAPMYQQVIDWFRNKKGTEIFILPIFREKCGYDSFRRDGFSCEIITTEPCQYLDFGMFNQCGEDRDDAKMRILTFLIVFIQLLIHIMKL